MTIKKKTPLKVKIFKFLIQKPIEFLNRSFSQVGNNTFHDLEMFSWVNELKEAFPKILSECTAVTHPKNLPNVQDIFSQESPIAWDENWKTYFIYLYWHFIKEHKESCPLTVSVIKNIPGIVSAFFSVLAPGKEIPEHVGPYNGVLRCHLALSIPAPKNSCGIRVSKDIRHWEASQILIFDDTHPHTAWNHSDSGYRVVLFIDFLRPLPKPIQFINKSFLRLISKDKDLQEGFKNLKNKNLTLEKQFL